MRRRPTWSVLPSYPSPNGRVHVVPLTPPSDRLAVSARSIGVAHARFPSFAQGRPLLVSAGNDGRVLLWDWAGVSESLSGKEALKVAAGAAGGGASPAAVASVVAEVQNGRKARRDSDCRLFCREKTCVSDFIRMRCLLRGTFLCTDPLSIQRGPRATGLRLAASCRPLGSRFLLEGLPWAGNRRHNFPKFLSLLWDVPQVNWIATVPGAGGSASDGSDEVSAPLQRQAAAIIVADTSRFLSHYVVRDG